MKKIIFFILCSSFAFAINFSFNSLVSNFSQIVNSNGKSVTYTGKFYIKSNQALWIYETPVSKKIYFDKQRVVVIEDELEQAIVSKLDDTPNLEKILANSQKIKGNIYKANYNDTDYTISIENGNPSVIEYKDKLDNDIKIQLSNLQKDIEIKDEILKPKIPKEYDIVRQ